MVGRADEDPHVELDHCWLELAGAWVVIADADHWIEVATSVGAAELDHGLEIAASLELGAAGA